MGSSKAVTLFRIAAVAEAISWAALLIAMGFKYVLDEPKGVEVVGPIHGGLFLAYIGACAIVGPRMRWDLRTSLLAVLAGLPPLATVAFERWATRTGRLA